MAALNDGPTSAPNASAYYVARDAFVQHRTTANLHAPAYLCWEMTRKGALLTAVGSRAACLQVNCDLGMCSAIGAMTSHTEQAHHDLSQKRVFELRLLRKILLISVLLP